MRTCLRVPRIFLPQRGFEEWAVIAPDAYASHRAYWEKVASCVGENPSTLRFLLPEILSEEAEDAPKRLSDEMYLSLGRGQIEKLNRGFILSIRKTPSGVRKGIVASVDLEEYSNARGESALIHSAQETDDTQVERLLSLRRAAPLEFPHTILLYRDKKDKIVRGLESEGLELLYDFELMLGGGHLKGYFIPDYLALDVIHELRSRTEPNFAVLDGEAALGAAKAHWEEVKKGLSDAEQRNHPARFSLVELVNIESDGVELCPVHRLLEDVDAEAFCDYFLKNVPSERRGSVLYPKVSNAVDGVKKTDEIIARFLRANTGTVSYLHGEKTLLSRAAQADCAGVVLKAIDKEDFFPALKGGNVFPKNTFSLGDDVGKRYCMEGREISYD